MDFAFWSGILGVCAILTGFLLINTHRVTADSLLYDVLNAVGSMLLIVSAVMTKAWPFVIVNGVFAVYSLKDILFQDLRPHRKVLRKA